MRWFKKKLYSLIRPLFVRNIDPNEDFVCMNCSMPVLRRILYCSFSCQLDLETVQRMKENKDKMMNTIV